MRIGTLKNAAELEAKVSGLGFQSPSSAVICFDSVNGMAKSGARGIDISSRSVDLANEQPQVGLSATPTMGPRVM